MIDALLVGLFDPVGVVVLWGLATIAGVAITRVLLRLVQGRNQATRLNSPANYYGRNTSGVRLFRQLSFRGSAGASLREGLDAVFTHLMAET